MVSINFTLNWKGKRNADSTCQDPREDQSTQECQYVHPYVALAEFHTNLFESLKKELKKAKTTTPENNSDNEVTELPSPTDYFSYFREMIPKELQPMVYRASSSSPDASCLKIYVCGIFIPGLFSATKDLSALREYAEQEPNIRSGNKFAFVLSGQMCEFFEVDSVDDGFCVWSLDKERELMRRTLHHCIYFSNPISFASHAQYFDLFYRVECQNIWIYYTPPWLSSLS